MRCFVASRSSTCVERFTSASPASSAHASPKIVQAVGRWWRTPLSRLFIDGGHGVEPARADFRGWVHRVMAGGVLVIHDVFLDDDLGGPLPTALYSAALFSITEGRAYSAAEYRAMLTKASLKPEGSVIPTLIHCGLLTARR